MEGERVSYNKGRQCLMPESFFYGYNILDFEKFYK